MLESKVEDYFNARIKALGGEVRKVKWLGRKSAPDRLALLPSDRAVRSVEEHPLVELKRPGKVPRPDQLREHAKLRAAGFIVLVLDSIEAVDKAFPL